MIATGVSPKLVAERMGHSNVSFTLSLYSHVLPGLCCDAEASRPLLRSFRPEHRTIWCTRQA